MSGQIAFVEFRKSAVIDRIPPSGLNIALQALWHDQRGNWEVAHNLAQEAEGRGGDWVHAYLHRKEGDEANARYWYLRAGRSFPTGSFLAEWEEITRELLVDPEAGEHASD